MDAVIEGIKDIAMKYKAKKVVLFGSRARRDHVSVSDYDIAVFHNDWTAAEKAYFCVEMEEIPTLKKIDVAFVEDSSTDELMKNIKRDGVVIYEQTGNEVK